MADERDSATIRRSRESWINATQDVAEAIRIVRNRDRVLVGGFGDSGYPLALLLALIDSEATDLHIISNNAGRGDWGIGGLIRAGRIAKLTATYPIAPGSQELHDVIQRSAIDIELVAQGVMAERIHAGGAGLGGILTSVGLHSDIPEGEGTRTIEVDETAYRLERPIRGHVALIAADTADRWGNLRFHRSARNFNPLMATAADYTIVQVRRVLDEPLDPDDVHLPGMYIDVLVTEAESDKRINERAGDFT